MIAGVTPSWLSANVPETAVGGGFTSRCIFVYGKEAPSVSLSAQAYARRTRRNYGLNLVADLEEISRWLESSSNCRGQAYGEEMVQKTVDRSARASARRTF